MTGTTAQPGGAQRLRLMGLRAIMDGRGLSAALLTSPSSVAFYGRGQGALVVTAADCVTIPGNPGRSEQFWIAVAAAVGSAHAIGYERDDLNPDHVAQLADVLGQRHIRDLTADISHHRAHAASQK